MDGVFVVMFERTAVAIVPSVAKQEFVPKVVEGLAAYVKVGSELLKRLQIYWDGAHLYRAACFLRAQFGQDLR